MITLQQDTIYQYIDGKDFLHATLIERGNVLQKLEQLALIFEVNCYADRCSMPRIEVVEIIPQ